MSATISHADPPLPHNSPDENRRLIDQEVQKLEDDIRALKSHRNTLAPISRLPPELLSKIFAFTIPDPLSKYPSSLDWVKVSHVSCHWRAVALDCPSLWGNLVFNRPRWCEEMLKRSKMADLVVKADLAFITPRIFEAVRLAMLHGPRIRELQLHATGNTIEKLLSTDPVLQLPMIRCLTLSVPPTYRYGMDESFSIPESLLNGGTPYLQQLDLHKCDISWDTRLFDGLTHLTIRDVQASARPTIEQLLNTLKRMPTLEVLDLTDVLPLSLPGPLVSPNEDMINLTQLTDLAINSTVSEFMSLVTRIKVPTTTRINITCNCTEVTTSDFAGAISKLCNPKGTSSRAVESGGSAERRVIRALHITCEPMYGFVLYGWKNPLSPEPACSDTNKPDIQLRLSWPLDWKSNVNTIITDTCNAIHVGHLRSLSFTHTSAIEKKTWVDTFGTIPKLRNVHVESVSTYTFIAALRDPAPKSSNCPKSPVSPAGAGVSQPRRRSKAPGICFPHLKILAIHNCNFNCDVNTGSTIGLLRDCLKDRLNHKAKLQELRLRECSYLDEDDVLLLEEVVPNVDWDGIVYDEDEEEDEEDSDEFYDEDFDDEIFYSALY